MKKKIIYFFFIILISCSSSEKNLIKVKKKENIKEPDVIYKLALGEYEVGRLQSSIDLLKTIEIHYQYTSLAPKSTLMISYIYYESNDYISALEYLKKFKEFYPASKHFLYAEFLTGLCLYEQINLVSKDQQPTELALKQFKKIIKNYPNSEYAKESNLKVNLIYEQIAGHNMYIARFYMKRNRWTSAMIKLQEVIEKYQNTIFIEEALHRMVEINYKIGNIQTAKKYAAILGYNYNSSDWYKKTYTIVGDKNYTNINQKEKSGLKNKLLSIFSFGKND